METTETKPTTMPKRKKATLSEKAILRIEHFATGREALTRTDGSVVGATPIDCYYNLACRVRIYNRKPWYIRMFSKI